MLNTTATTLPEFNSDTPIATLYDSGASRSILHLDVNSQQIQTRGKVTLPIQFCDVILQQDFIVANGISEDAILGIDALTTHSFVIHGGQQRIYIDNAKFIGKIQQIHDTRLKMKNTAWIPPKQTVIIEAIREIPRSAPATEAEYVFTPSGKLPKGVKCKLQYV